MQQRFGGPLPALLVRRTKFLDTMNAVVMFGIVNADGHSLISDQIGRAILEGDRWKMNRSTFARLASLASVAIPPPN